MAERSQMMRVSQKEAIQRNTVRALAAGTVLLLSVLAMVVVISADETEPTWNPPLISKDAVPQTISLGDHVTFYIVVENPEQPQPPYELVVPWFQVEATDAISTVFRVDDVGIVAFKAPSPPIVSQALNTVKVTVSRMNPTDYFVLRIDCTLVGPVGDTASISNVAQISYYVDEEGRLGREYFYDSAVVKVRYYLVMLPVVLRSYVP
jgi:hypothetical protein